MNLNTLSFRFNKTSYDKFNKRITYMNEKNENIYGKNFTLNSVELHTDSFFKIYSTFLSK